MANMAKLSRKLEARAAEEAELAAEELKALAAAEDEDEDEEMDVDAPEDANGDIAAEPFHLPTAAEREQEKASGGPDVHLVQRRMRECVRVLSKFSKRAEKGRSVSRCSLHALHLSLLLYRSRSEYVDQLIADIASYYGYNEFLAEKLFQLFAVNEAGIFASDKMIYLLNL